MNESGSTNDSVGLRDGQSASALLHQVLTDACASFPDSLAGASIPDDPAAFRRAYTELLPAFEAARLGSSERSAIARHMVVTLKQQITWDATGEVRPLDEALARPASPLPLEVSTPVGEPGWQPDIVWRGERWVGSRIAALGEELARQGMATSAAADALAWVDKHLLTDNRLQLRGRKIVVLGGGAEMAPTRFFLEAGAEVLWVDISPPPAEWFERSRVPGRLHWHSNGIDLLTRPREVLATIIAFADNEPVDLGLYAYAPGQARELRLTAAMNAIVDAMPRALVSSVTMLLSPTTPTALLDEDIEAMQGRRARRPKWEAALAAAGLLGRGSGSVQYRGGAVTRSVVGIQGTSYQAAQYLGKLMTAECWSVHGAPGAEKSQPLRVSANTAPITRTRSLDHPVFAAAFGGADAFGVQTFTPRQSRPLGGLLALADWLREAPPVPGKVRVHGGIHTLPYPLEPALRVAATFGFARSPRLLRGLLRR